MRSNAMFEWKMELKFKKINQTVKNFYGKFTCHIFELSELPFRWHALQVRRALFVNMFEIHEHHQASQ